MAPPQGTLVLHRLIWDEKFKKKIFLSETWKHRPLIFGMSLYQSHILCENSVLPKLSKAKFHTKLLYDKWEIKVSISNCTGYHNYVSFFKMLP